MWAGSGASRCGHLTSPRPFPQNLRDSKDHQWGQCWDVSSKVPRILFVLSPSPHPPPLFLLLFFFQDPNRECFIYPTLISALLSASLGADPHSFLCRVGCVVQSMHCIWYPVRNKSWGSWRSSQSARNERENGRRASQKPVYAQRGDSGSRLRWAISEKSEDRDC